MKTAAAQRWVLGLELGRVTDGGARRAGRVHRAGCDPPASRRLDRRAGIDRQRPRLSFAVLLITACALGDRLRRRRLFAGGLGLFVLASAACALAPNAGLLTAARSGMAYEAMIAPLVLAGAGISMAIPAKGGPPSRDTELRSLDFPARLSTYSRGPWSPRLPSSTSITPVVLTGRWPRRRLTRCTRRSSPVSCALERGSRSRSSPSGSR